MKTGNWFFIIREPRLAIWEELERVSALNMLLLFVPTIENHRCLSGAFRLPLLTALVIHLTVKRVRFETQSFQGRLRFLPLHSTTAACALLILFACSVCRFSLTAGIAVAIELQTREQYAFCRLVFFR